MNQEFKFKISFQNSPFYRNRKIGWLNYFNMTKFTSPSTRITLQQPFSVGSAAYSRFLKIHNKTSKFCLKILLCQCNFFSEIQQNQFFAFSWPQNSVNKQISLITVKNRKKSSLGYRLRDLLTHPHSFDSQQRHRTIDQKIPVAENLQSAYLYCYK